MLSTALSKILAAKAAAAVVLVAGATGGVALAATASGGPDAPPAERPAAARTAAPSETAGNGPGAAGTSRPETPTTAAPAAPQPPLVGLCTAWAAGATDNPGAAAENPAFRALVEAAGSASAVPGYCADLEDAGAPRLTDHPRAGDGEHPSGPPTDKPGAVGTPGAANRGVPPTAAPGKADHPAGPPEKAAGQEDRKGEDSSSSQRPGPDRGEED